MSQMINVQEIAIVVVANGNTPITLNAEFLKYGGIVPEDWELAKAPICSAQGSQVTYQAGVNLISLPDRLNFAEVLADKEEADVQVARITQKYVQALPNLNYQGVGINFRGHVSFATEAQAHHYVTQTLMQPGAW